MASGKIWALVLLLAGTLTFPTTGARRGAPAAPRILSFLQVSGTTTILTATCTSTSTETVFEESPDITDTTFCVVLGDDCVPPAKRSAVYPVSIGVEEPEFFFNPTPMERVETTALPHFELRDFHPKHVTYALAPSRGVTQSSFPFFKPLDLFFSSAPTQKTKTLVPFGCPSFAAELTTETTTTTTTSTVTTASTTVTVTLGYTDDCDPPTAFTTCPPSF